MVLFPPLQHLHIADIISGSINGSNITECADGNQWIYKNLQQCLDTTMQWSSFAVGMLAVAIFVWVMVPQIVRNQKDLKSVDSISLGLLFCWCCGDTTNFVGAFMTKQGIFQEVLALIFVAVDMVLVAQVVYYYNCYRKKEAEVPPAVRNGSLVLCLMGLLSLLTPFSSRLFSSDSLFSSPAARRGRTLLSVGDSSEQQGLGPFFHNWTLAAGYSIGIISALFYAGSRTFQIVKNAKHKAVAGLEVGTFVLCIVGNSLYGLAIVLYSLDKDYLLEHLPWIIGSWGIVMLDCFVIYQIRTYKDMVGEMLREEVEVDIPSDDEEASLLNPNRNKYGTVN